MSADLKRSFLTYYVRGLKERTRVEKSSVKTGIDWPVYGLCLAKGLTPIRLPFFRNKGDEFPKAKAGSEFGIDEAFLSSDGKVLTIFALKDEALTYRNWNDAGFERDMRMALAPDLSGPSLGQVSEVVVILAYNQDEDRDGLQCYSNFVAASPSKIGDLVALRHERWNLDRLTSELESHLFNANLLPERYFSLFSYICSQFSDFAHGSDQWEQQLIPNWKRLLSEVFGDLSVEKAILLLPVTLMILREHGSANVSAQTGYLDLVEWATLHAWAGAKKSGDPIAIRAAEHMFSNFYLSSLETFYSEFGEALTGEHVIDVSTPHGGGMVDHVAAAIRGLWHVARVGILAFGYFELLVQKTPKEKQDREAAIKELATLMIRLLNASPSVDRPILDIHHIELFLIWRTLVQAGKRQDAVGWMSQLERKLFVRRVEQESLFFIDGHTELNSVWEYAATGERPPEFNDESSSLVLMLMILCFGFSAEDRNALLGRYQSFIVLAQDLQGETLREKKPLNLMAWHPPDGWENRILAEPIGIDGECMVLDLFSDKASLDGQPIASQIEAFATEFRSKRDARLPDDIPQSLIILACLKHLTPMPLEMWLHSAFPKNKGSSH
jgi:hypothetical protein